MPEGSYFGGKGAAGTYQRLINEIPPHGIYVECCLGFGSILRKKRPAAKSHGIELDAETLAEWRGDEVPGLTLHQADAIEWLRHFFGLTTWPAPAPRTPAEQLAAAAAVFGGVVPFVFADPPYPHSTRRADRYRFEFSDDQHRRLLTVLRTVPAQVMVTSYPNELYAEVLHDWRTFTFQNLTRGGIVTEQAWCNYAEPVELHDTRYIGSNKRQRERIHRRRRNWRQSIERMGPQERQALAEEVAAASAKSAARNPAFRLLWQAGNAYAWQCGYCGKLPNRLDVPFCPGCLRDARPAQGAP